MRLSRLAQSETSVSQAGELGVGAWDTQRMSTPRVRDFHEDDLDQVVRVWEESRQGGAACRVYGLAEVLGRALRDEGAGVVATGGGAGRGRRGGGGNRVGATSVKGLSNGPSRTTGAGGRLGAPC